jgi:hypothetical protein
MNKELLLEKYIKVAVRKALKEQEEQQRKAEKAMYLVYRFPGLKKLMTDLMSPAFGRYVSGINIVAPKPTTFSVSLINGQDFTIKYIGNKKWNVKVSGKQYHPDNIGEEERCSQAIADLLELNYSTAEGKEQTSAAPETGGGEAPPPAEPTGPGAAELGPELAAAEETPPAPEEETPPAEA